MGWLELVLVSTEGTLMLRVFGSELCWSISMLRVIMDPYLMYLDESLLLVLFNGASFCFAAYAYVLNAFISCQICVEISYHSFRD